MRPSLLILPFLAILTAAIGTVLKSAFPHLPWIAYAGWGVGAAIILAWVALDAAGFKAMFGRKGAKYGAASGATIIAALLAIGAAAKISNLPRFNKTYDTTKTGINTLSDQSKKIVDNFKEKNTPVETLVFFDGEQTKQQIREMFQLYEMRGLDFKATYLNTRADPVRAQAEKLTSLNTIIFRSGTREARVTTFTEEKITNALIQMLQDKTRKIYFTSGHGESDIKSGDAGGLQWVVQELENNKYHAEELSLLESAKVPDDADLLVIAGPKYDLKAEELRFVDDYVSRGGPLFVMVSAAVSVPGLNGLLEKYGLKFAPDIMILRPDDPRSLLYGNQIAIVSEFDKLNAFTKDFANESSVELMLPMSRSITLSDNNAKNMKVTAVGKTSNVMIQVKGIENSNDLKLGSVPRDRIGIGEFGVIAVATGQTQPAATAGTDASNKDDATKQDVTDSSQPAKKELRIVAVGSGEFAANGALKRGAENRDLFVNITNYLLQDENFISIRPKDPTKSTLQLSSGGSQLLLLSLAFIYPFVFLFGGVVHWARRRRA